MTGVIDPVSISPFARGRLSLRDPSKAPLLSAILCTYDNADRLAPALESLCRQTLPPEAFEVVLIDDGSSDGTRELARTFGCRLPLRYSRERHAGLASARNHGIFLARGAIILFLDDDDVAHPGLLEAHCEAHRRYPELSSGVLGFTEIDPAIASDPLMHFATTVGGSLLAYPELRDGDILDFRYFRAGRASCKRAFLVQHGVFNPLFRDGCGDLELAYRLARRGFQIVYDAAARSTMTRCFGYDEFCARLHREGRSNFFVSRLHKTAAIREWTQVRGAEALWHELRPRYDAILGMGRERDRIVRLRLASGLPIGEPDWELLHRGYASAFRASKIKGIVDGMAELGEDLARGSATAMTGPLR